MPINCHDVTHTHGPTAFYSFQCVPYLAGECRPEVDTGAQPYTQNILAAPVDKVEIEVILELGGVKNLEGNLGYLPRGFPGTAEKLDALGRDWGQRVRGGGLIDDVGPPRSVGEEIPVL